jgi:hypothetical protein
MLPIELQWLVAIIAFPYVSAWCYAMARLLAPFLVQTAYNTALDLAESTLPTKKV